MKKSLILIGMPGSGKSTIGVMLAKHLGLNFIDTDIIIQERQQCTLQTIIDKQGYSQLREIESQMLLSLNPENTVVSTGGSVVYCAKGMRHLTQFGTVIFLDVSLKILKVRVHNYETRGLAKRPDQSFEDLFNERRALYLQYADIQIKSDELNPHQTLELLLSKLSQ